MRRQDSCFGLLLVAVVMALGQTGRGLGQGGAESSMFLRGDPNADGQRNITDSIYLLGCFFLGTDCAACADAADVNDDGLGNITDPIFLLNFLFLGGAAPPAPGAACGPDPTGDDLDCASFPRCALADDDTLPTARGDLIITPIEHATLVLEWDQKTIYVDPVGGAARFAALPAPDLILVTHTHGDHLDTPTIRGVARAGTMLVTPRTVSEAIARAGGAGAAEGHVLPNGDRLTAAGIEIEAVAMYNLTADRLRYHAKGDGNGYVLDLAGTRVYVAGDTEDIPELRGLQAIALAFVCMNLPFTMTPEQAASAVLEFKPRVVYPYHYSGQDPQRFKSLVEAGSEGIQVRVRNWYAR